jgi:hypothetical protein
MICYKNCLSILHTHAVCHLIFVFASEKAEPTKKQRTRHRASYVFDAVFFTICLGFYVQTALRGLWIVYK